MVAEVNLIQKLKFDNLGDSRGHLVSLEALKNIPFEIKRVYYLVGTHPGESRGFHAHRELKQVLICLAGQCRIVLDDGQNKSETILNSFNEGILIESMIWREMHDFSADCVLLVIANQHYSESDYIRNYDDFKRLYK